MDFPGFLTALFGAGVLGYIIGRTSGAQPSESEMIGRLRKIRLQRKLSQEVNEEIEKELQL